MLKSRFAGKKILYTRLAVFIAACGLLLAGILLGDLPLIFRKAVMICLECIGIG
ncbi:CD1871A family CXXC motif-containing protein [Brucepastera parasyntrophica]|uniref:CD1871A family CXXC motif-containing protein n=1 Tax=Brucepastera parasyntrophica TaxID=2880008 RepID=UPI00210C7314|nr:CD1871A family CXXC motif-containing protein [Brucepastera parasyntrophica]